MSRKRIYYDVQLISEHDPNTSGGGMVYETFREAKRKVRKSLARARAGQSWVASIERAVMTPEEYEALPEYHEREDT